MASQVDLQNQFTSCCFIAKTYKDESTNPASDVAVLDTLIGELKSLKGRITPSIPFFGNSDWTSSGMDERIKRVELIRDEILVKCVPVQTPTSHPQTTGSPGIAGVARSGYDCWCIALWQLIRNTPALRSSSDSIENGEIKRFIRAYEQARISGASLPTDSIKSVRRAMVQMNRAGGISADSSRMEDAHEGLMSCYQLMGIPPSLYNVTIPLQEASLPFYQLLGQHFQRSTQGDYPKLFPHGHFPEELIIHLGRFSGDGQNRVAKIERGVDAPLTFNHTLLPGDYDLDVIIEHIGETPFGGHYVAYVRTDRGWHYCNDDVVHRVDASTVAAAAQRGYLLHYRRRQAGEAAPATPAPTPPIVEAELCYALWLNHSGVTTDPDFGKHAYLSDPASATRAAPPWIFHRGSSFTDQMQQRERALRNRSKTDADLKLLQSLQGDVAAKYSALPQEDQWKIHGLAYEYETGPRVGHDFGGTKVETARREGRLKQLIEQMTVTAHERSFEGQMIMTFRAVLGSDVSMDKIHHYFHHLPISEERRNRLKGLFWQKTRVDADELLRDNPRRILDIPLQDLLLA